MRVLLVCSLLAFALVPGCTDSTSGLELSGGEAYDLAAPVAAEWSADAVLMSATGVEVGADFDMEGAAMMAEMEAEEAYGAISLDGAFGYVGSANGTNGTGMDTVDDVRDSRPGDGLAPVWFFTFTDGEGVLPVIVSGGKVLEGGLGAQPMSAEMAGMGCLGYCLPIGNWTLDSDDAADAAAEADPAFADLRGDDKAAGSYTLTNGGNRTYWLAALATMGDTPAAAAVAVDAVTGEVADPSVVLQLPLTREFGTDSTPVTAVQPEASWIANVVQSGHRSMAVMVRSQGLAAPLQAVEVRVTSPDGTVTQGAFTTAPMQGGSTVLQLPAVPAGAYTVEASLGTGAFLNLAMSWCTDGFDLTGGDVPAVCDEA